MEKLNILKVKNGGVEGLNVAIVVHHGVFHADDGAAAGLVVKYYDRLTNSSNTYYVARVPHQSDINKIKEEIKEQLGDNTVVFVADVGRIYNPSELMFDHHQFGSDDDQFGHAAAGLVYNYFKEKKAISEFEIEELDEFVRMIDENDIGLWEGPYEGTFPWIVALHNAKDIYSKEQDERFVEIVKMVIKILDDVEDRAKVKTDTFEKLKSSKEILPGVLEMPGYLPGWNELIFKLKEFNHIDLVIWFDENQGTWKIQQVPDAPGSFGRRGRAVPFRDPLPEGCQFLHRGNFFGVFNSKEALIDYIKSI
jgi:uncharacterized UPF0160 family protein